MLHQTLPYTLNAALHTIFRKLHTVHTSHIRMQITHDTSRFTLYTVHKKCDVLIYFRTLEGGTVCNACGLYQKLHNVSGSVLQ